MKVLKKVLGALYWLALIVLTIKGYSILAATDGTWEKVFHLAYWAPSIGMLAIISGQFDLLLSIDGDGVVNMKARCLDFIHWLFLMFLNIGAWLVGGTAISWFILKIILLGIIGWQIGVGINRRWRPTKNEKIAGTIALVFSMLLGITAGWVRYLDTSEFGWGWMVESTTAVVSTLIVAWWIWMDLQTISMKAKDYPRSTFLKGIFSNSLIVWFWLHVMYLEGGFAVGMLHQLGLTFNTIVGNLLYLGYYAAYEHHKAKQTRASLNT